MLHIERAAALKVAPHSAVVPQWFACCFCVGNCRSLKHLSTSVCLSHPWSDKSGLLLSRCLLLSAVLCFKNKSKHQLNALSLCRLHMLSGAVLHLLRRKRLVVETWAGSGFIRLNCRAGLKRAIKMLPSLLLWHLSDCWSFRVPADPWKVVNLKFYI